MLPNPAEIQYFLEVASTQNISRAAERLGITQPTLSLAIQRLENALGTPLLLRGKTGVKLTKAGSRFAAQAKVLLDQWERLRSDAISEETEVRGRVSVGCHPSVALYTLGVFVPKLLAQYPDLELAFHHDLSRRITERVISFEIDIGVVVNPVAHPDLRIVQLAKDEVTFWRGPGAFPKDVLISDPDLIQTQSLLAKAKKGVGVGDLHFKRLIPSSSLEVIAKLTASGAGVGILPTRVAKSEPSYKLKPLFEKGDKAPIFEDKICLIYRPDSQKGQAARAVMKAIEGVFKE